MRIEFHVGPCQAEVFHCPSDFRLQIEGTPLAPGWYWGEPDWVLDHTTTYGPHLTAGNAVDEAVRVLGEYPSHLPAAQQQPPRVASANSDRWLTFGALVGAFILGIAAGAAIAGREARETGATIPPGTAQPAAAGAAYGAHGTGAGTGIAPPGSGRRNSGFSGAGLR